MHRRIVTPVIILLSVAGLAALAVGMVLWATAQTRWLGVPLLPAEHGIVLQEAAYGAPAGTLVETIGLPGSEAMTLEARDLLAEYDGLATYAEIAAFLARQDRLAVLLAEDQVELGLVDATGTRSAATVPPVYRPLWTMPPSFWIQLITGVASFIISGWVWALRPRQLAPALFALSGVGVLLTTATSAYYAHRGLALPAGDYALLGPINHAGVLLFGACLAALFLIYPRRLVSNARIWLLPAVVVPYFLLDANHLLFEAAMFYNVALGLTLAILILIGVQWWATRQSPDERAVLGWLGLSVALGVGTFSLVSLAPTLFGLPTLMSQHYAAGALVIIYGGLALGLRRYRLFELGEWAYRILFYTVGAFLLLGLDALLIAGLNLDMAPALGISLLLVGLAYLPLRDWLWGQLFARRSIAQHELFSAAMDVAFAPRPAERTRRWRDLLDRLFAPLQTTELSDPPARPQMQGDGLALELPPVAGAPALRLAYPFSGGGLFTPGHLALADQMVALITRAEEGREAYMRGVGEERRRMARDLHDDVGARLLTGLHTADETTRPTLQAALSDIRAIVSGLSGDEASLDRVLAETRHEAARRLEAAGIELDWPLPEDEVETVQLDYRLHKALTSAMREIVSNVIRHSGARRFTVTQLLSPGQLALRFADDGRGIPPTALSGEASGFGLRNLRHRIADIGGRLALHSHAGGTAIELSIPLVLTPHTPEPGVPDPADPLKSPV